MKKAIVITSLLAILAIGIYKFAKKNEGETTEPIAPDTDTDSANGEDSVLNVRLVEPSLIAFGEEII